MSVPEPSPVEKQPKKISKGLLAIIIIAVVAIAGGILWVVLCVDFSSWDSQSSSKYSQIEELQSLEEQQSLKEQQSLEEQQIPYTTGPAVSSMASLDLSQYQSTPSGLRYKVIKEGEGNHPAATDMVLVNYEGKLVDGTVFDSSFQRGQPISFPLNAVIPGWTEGVQLMTPGSVYEFVIPYNLAYGEMGRPPVIPQKADLVFLVELISIQ